MIWVSLGERPRGYWGGKLFDLAWGIRWLGNRFIVLFLSLMLISAIVQAF
jgi:hypothetical protein